MAAGQENEAPFSPSNDDISNEAVQILTQSPSIGLPSLLRAIKKSQPAWALSEKAQTIIPPLTPASQEGRRVSQVSIHFFFISNFSTHSEFGGSVDSRGEDVDKRERTLRNGGDRR
jgi:hypothetical protein